VSAKTIDGYLGSASGDLFCQIYHSHVSSYLSQTCECDDGYTMFDAQDELFDFKQTMVCLKDDTIYPMPMAPGYVIPHLSSWLQVDPQVIDIVQRKACAKGETAGADEKGVWFCGSWGATTPPPAASPVRTPGDSCGQNATVATDLKCYCNAGYDWASTDPSSTDCAPVAQTPGTPPPAPPKARKEAPPKPKGIESTPAAAAPEPTGPSTGMIVGTLLALGAAVGVGVLVAKRINERDQKKVM